MTTLELKYGRPYVIDDIKAVNDGWEVSGYLSTYNNVDLGNDVVMPGAFDRWLASGEKTRYLYSHRPDQVLGVWLELRSDNKGLFGRSRISKTQLGHDVRLLVTDGAVDSFSIGYIPQGKSYDGDVRLLKDLDLPEASLVAMPMNPQAVVTAVKQWAEQVQHVNELSDAPTLAERAAKLAAGLDELLTDVQAVAQAGPGALNQKKREQLAQLLETLSGLSDARTGIKQILVPQTGTVRLAEQYEVRNRLAQLYELIKE